MRGRRWVLPTRRRAMRAWREPICEASGSDAGATGGVAGATTRVRGRRGTRPMRRGEVQTPRGVMRARRGVMRARRGVMRGETVHWRLDHDRPLARAVCFAVPRPPRRFRARDGRCTGSDGGVEFETPLVYLSTLGFKRSLDPRWCDVSRSGYARLKRRAVRSRCFECLLHSLGVIGSFRCQTVWRGGMFRP